MNISTGGPHILIFERDQQLAVLLTSELQLAGYECHVARTAVEVFDAIARFSVRLVLVNLAQAAASRREFWVALDTQRRGSGIQVFTFHCSNIASYGPRDSDDYSQASMADMEIDGMVGLMKLVDTVRARVPSTEVSAATAPRMPRAPIHNDPAESQQSTSSRFAESDNTMGSVSRSANRPLPQPSMNTPMQGQSGPNTSVMQGTSQAYLATSPATQLPTGSQATYSDKIRAVLYPNPHSSSPHSGVGAKGNTSASPSRYGPDTSKSYSPQKPPLPVNPVASSGTSVLQRLANGQIYSSPGLAELSRLVNEYQSSDKQENSSQPVANQLRGPEGLRPSSNVQVEQVGSQALTNALLDQQNGNRDTQAESSNQERGQASQLGGSAQSEPSAIRASFGGTPTVLRAAPIEDLPLVRSAGNLPAYGMAIKPSPDGVSHATVSPLGNETLPLQPISELPFPTQPSLNSIITGTANWPIESSSPTSLNAPPSAATWSSEKESPVSRERETVSLTTEPAYQREVTESRYADRSQKLAYQREGSEPARRPDRSQKRGSAEPPRRSDHVQEPADQRGSAEPVRRSERLQKPLDQREVTESHRQSDHVQESLNPLQDFESLRRSDRSPESLYQDILSGKDIDENIDTRNAVILDILQSLPAVAKPSDQQEQAIQPQVHNGRATRSLGNVLLDGHLVPQDRLEVAQNIQRMLRGVDMNYQLGEILLMFKLLTPDQLLAASLVGYGLITRTQIVALGRIRQELHSIGLEYDLENLVILFRILTPEQVREARSSVLG